MRSYFNPRFLLLPISLIIYLSIALTPVWSQGTPETQGLFSASATLPSPTTVSRQGSMRARLVVVNFEHFGRPNADAVNNTQERAGLSKTLTLNFFDDTILTADLEAIEPRMLANTGFVWIGRIRGYPYSSAVVTAGGGQIHAIVNLGTVAYEVSYAGNNLHLVRQVDPRALPYCGVGLFPPSSVISTTPVPTLKNDNPFPVATDDGSLIDVMLVYGNNAYATVVNDTGMINEGNTAIALANVSFTNSQMDPVPRFRLVHAYHADYTEHDDLGVDLDHLLLISDGYMDEIHQLRDLYHADLVAMITNPAVPNYGGLGFVLPRNATAISFQEYGFSINLQWSLSGYVLTHEMGHNMGGNHNIEDVYPDSFRPYSYGYRDDGYFHTIMSYGCLNVDCPGVNYWSNQIILYNGRPMGSSVMDNRQSILESRGIVANFRDSSSNGSCPAPTVTIEDGATLFNSTANFRWAVSGGCTIRGYDFRIKDISDMNAGGTTIVNASRTKDETYYSTTFDSAWFDRDLYMGVRVANATSGAAWAVRRFRIDPTPAVRITQPISGGTYAGPIIHIEATVDDSTIISSIDHLQFFAWSNDAWAGGQWVVLGEDHSYPFGFDWDITALPDTTTAYISAYVYDPFDNGYFIPNGASITINKIIPSSTPTPTNTRTVTATRTATLTPTRTLTSTASATRTLTPTATKTATSTATLTRTFTVTATRTLTPTPTKTVTPTATKTATPTATVTRSVTPQATFTATPTKTNTLLPLATATPTTTGTLTAGHPDTIGIFRSSISTFYMRNSNTTGFADSSITFGASTDFPVTGDWNGDGIDTIGVYRQSTGQFFLSDSTANPAALHYSFTLGNPNDQPIVGDWDGDGKDGVGVFRPTNGLIYLKNSLTTGFADFTMVLGSPGDVGIAGDWNGDGKDSPGVYRPSNQVFYLTNAICNCSVFADAELGLGIAGDTPFVGDWDGDGKSGVGVYRQSNGLTYIKNVLTTGFADASFVFGSASDYPLAGYWVRVNPPAVEPAPTFQP